MPFNGSGTFARLYNWVTDKANAVKITASRMDDEFDGIAAGLSNCMTRDGQSPPAQDIPFNNKRITGLGDATTNTDALNRQSADARYVLQGGSSAISAATAAARLSVTSGVAVTEADVMGAGSIFYVPAGHNIAPIYDGTVWQPRLITSEPSVSIAATSANAHYSVFRYWDGSQVRIGYGPVWSNATTIGTGLGTSETEVFEGRTVNKNDITLTINGGTAAVLARRAVLIGGFATTSIAGQTEDSLQKRLLSNFELAQPRPMRRIDPVNSNPGGTADVWRKAFASSLNVLEVFQISGGRAAKAHVLGIVTPDTVGGAAGVGIGVGTSTDTDTPHADCLKHRVAQGNAGFRLFCEASWAGTLGVGRRQMKWLDNTNGVGSFIWIGDNGDVWNQSGIRGEVLN